MHTSTEEVPTAGHPGLAIRIMAMVGKEIWPLTTYLGMDDTCMGNVVIKASHFDLLYCWSYYARLKTSPNPMFRFLRSIESLEVSFLDFVYCLVKHTEVGLP